MSTPTHRVLADVRVRVTHPDPRPADGTGHAEWAVAVREERDYLERVLAHGHQPTWADRLRLGAALALAATDATTLRRELLDLSGVLVGWVEDLDTRARHDRAGS